LAYTEKNYQSKKELKQAVADGKKVAVFNPGLGGPINPNGKVYLEGPHYPQPHKWYAEAWLQDGYIIKVK